MIRLPTKAPVLLLAVLAQHCVALAEPDQPPYISSLVDAYALGEVSGRTLGRTCASAAAASGDNDNIRIMRDQNKSFCDAYTAGIVEIAGALRLQCERSPDAATIRRLAREELARAGKGYSADFAGAVLSRGFKCVR